MSKKSIFTTIITLFLCAFFSLSAQANTMVGINEKNFPDENFRDYVQKFDTNQDGSLDEQELNSVTRVEVSQRWITDLSGIEYFTNLQVLYCNQNRIPTIDLSQNTKLVELSAWLADLYSLDLSHNTDLESLTLSSNSLASLDLSNNKKLKKLDMGTNARPFYSSIVNTSLLPGFDISRSSQWVNASVKGTFVTVIDPSQRVTYMYDLGNGTKTSFAWLFRDAPIQEPTLTQTITAQPSYTKNYGDPKFKILASTTGDGTLSFSSNKSSVATISSNGEVQIKGSGTATITITAAKTNMYLAASKDVILIVLPKKISLDSIPSSYTFTYGDNTTSLYPRAHASDTPSLTYRSNNERIVKVNQSGDIQVIGAGSTYIQVTLKCDNYEPVSKTIKVIVRPKPLYISGIKSSYSTTYGKKFSIKPISEGKISYTVKDTKVATINNGKVTTKGPGKTTIVVTSSLNSNYTPTTQKVTIVVKPKTMAKPKVSVSNKKLKVSWKKDTKVSGYELWYATNTKFNKGKKVTTLKKSSYTKKTLTLKKKGTYYVKIRSYKLVGKEKIYSSFSKAAKVRIR